MSLFDFEIPHVQGVTFDPASQVSGTGSAAPSNGVPNGTVWYDISGSLSAIVPASITSSGLVVALDGNQTAVTNTNATAATAAMTYAFPAGSLNALGRSLNIFAGGLYTTDSGTGRTQTIAMTFGDGTNTRTLATWTTGATTASATTMPWNFEYNLIVSAKGTAGTLYGHGTLFTTLGTNAAASGVIYNDQNTAASSALDLTKVITLSVTQLFSGSNAGNTFTQDLLLVNIAN